MPWIWYERSVPATTAQGCTVQRRGTGVFRCIAQLLKMQLWPSHLISRPILVQSPVETCPEACLSRATTLFTYPSS